MSKEKDLAINTLILSIGTFLPKFAAIVTIPIITGHLTKVEYGTYDLLGTSVSLLLPIVTLQIHSAAFRFLIDCRDNQTDRRCIITNIYCFLIPTSLIALLIMFICLNKLNLVTRILVVIYFFADIMILGTQQIVRGLSKNKLYSTSAVIQSIVNMLLVVLTVQIVDMRLIGVLVSFIVATVTGTCILFVHGKLLSEIKLNLFSFKVIKQMLSYSWPMIPNTLSSWVLTASDRFVLSGFMGLEAVAIYAAANKIPSLFMSVQSTFIFAWQENASLALSDSTVEKYYSDMFDNIFSILSGIMALLIGCTPILFWLLIKGDYAEAYLQMPILFMGMFFSAISAFLGGIYVAHKRTKSVGITTMLSAVCNLIIDLALVKFIGIYAASISTLISYTFLSIYRMADVKKFQPISYKLHKITLSIAFLFVLCIVCFINILSTNVVNLVISVCFAYAINKKTVHKIFYFFKKKIGI